MKINASKVTGMFFVSNLMRLKPLEAISIFFGKISQSKISEAKSFNLLPIAGHISGRGDRARAGEGSFGRSACCGWEPSMSEICFPCRSFERNDGNPSR